MTSMIDELGDLAWLRVLDVSEFEEFAVELSEALVAADNHNDIFPVSRVVHAWKETARQLQDPLSRSILLGKWGISDFVEVERPE